MTTRRLVPLSLLIAVAMLAACQPSSPDSATSQPAATQPAPSGAVTTQPDGIDAAGLPAGWQRIAGDALPTVEAAAQQLPATVRSDDEVEATVADTSRTIAGGDDVIAVMEALGLAGQVYAAPTSSTTAAGRAAPKQFLFNRTTGVEGVLSLDGTLFLGNSLRRHAKSGLAQRLRDAGLAVVVVDDLQPAPDKVRKVAAALGLPAQGDALATQVAAQLDEARAIGEASPRKPVVLHVSATGAGGQPTVGGRDSAAAAQIRLAGGENAGDALGVHDYSTLSPEGVVAANPEVVLVSEGDLARFGGEDGLWQAYPTLRQTRAGRANRVWVMPDLQLKSTSIASGTGAVALARALSALATEPANAEPPAQ